MADVTTVHIDLSRLEHQVNQLAALTNEIGNVAVNTNQKVDQVNAELQALKKEFIKMLADQKRTAALQQATTELIRVRQEIAQNFGGYKTVRETMLGVLQATDAALVKKTTISRVSEELMLTNPKYWLAPCLIAVAAWIGNDRQLAERAIAEAVKRDEERTSLTMALICRRNNRTDTCYEWLSRYFAKQNAANFTEGSFTYLSAYLNGIFGHDSKHMCDDYVARWMAEIRSGGEDFEQDQIARWKEYCKGFSIDVDSMFPDLGPQVYESARIKEYVSRIYAVDPIADTLTGIQTAEVNQDKLKADVDRSLLDLIRRYDKDEEPLRREERFLSAVKYFNGDREAAKQAILQQDEKRKERAIDLVGQMTNIVMKRDAKPTAEQKTAISFLHDYIKKGFDSYISEPKEDFPKEIHIQMDGWQGSTSDGNNLGQLKQEYVQSINRARANRLQELSSAQVTGFPMSVLIMLICAAAGIVFGVIGIATERHGLAALIVLGIFCGILALVFYMKTQKSNAAIAEQIQTTNRNYDTMLQEGTQKIDRIVYQWMQAKHQVYQFEHNPVREVVA